MLPQNSSEQIIFLTKPKNVFLIKSFKLSHVWLKLNQVYTISHLSLPAHTIATHWITILAEGFIKLIWGNGRLIKKKVLCKRICQAFVFATEIE